MGRRVPSCDGGRQPTSPDARAGVPDDAVAREGSWRPGAVLPTRRAQPPASTPPRREVRWVWTWPCPQPPRPSEGTGGGASLSSNEASCPSWPCRGDTSFPLHL